MLAGRPAAADGGGGYEEPRYPTEELRGLAPPAGRGALDMRAVLARLLDGSRFDEFKANYGKTLITGGWQWVGGSSSPAGCNDANAGGAGG